MLRSRGNDHIREQQHMANGILSEKVTDKTSIPPPDWEALIGQVADEIMAEHTPQRILQVRAQLYDLLSHCIPPTTILKVASLLLSCGKRLTVRRH